MRILVAEDDLTSRLMLQAVLRKSGYEVTSVADGEEAWAVLQQPDPPQLVLLDWMMPGLDGISLCRMLRAQGRNVPLYILLLTSRGEQRNIVQGLEAGADDYVAKPYDNEELLARIGVGRRILELLAEVAQRHKLQGVLEMAGAVCHELNQPLQAVSGYSELLLLDFDEHDSHAEMLRALRDEVHKIGELTRRIMSITEHRTKDYLGGRRTIVDIEKASSEVGERAKTKA